MSLVSCLEGNTVKRFVASLFAVVVCAAVVALAPAPAYAVDGTVLINQNTIINGLPGCPTGGQFPIIICQSGSYKLSGNLVVPAGLDGIDITADGVTLDLNGFTMIGLSGVHGWGVSSFNSNVTVQNGHIKGFGTLDGGVRLAALNETVRQMSLTGAPAQGSDDQGVQVDYGIISETTVSNFDIGISIEDGSVTHCNSAHNSEIQVLINDGMVTGSDITGGTYGVTVQDSAASVTNNLIHDSYYGLYFFAGGRGGYGANTFMNNSVDVSGQGHSVSMHDNVCSDFSNC